MQAQRLVGQGIGVIDQIQARPAMRSSVTPRELQAANEHTPRVFRSTAGDWYPGWLRSDSRKARAANGRLYRVPGHPADRGRHKSMSPVAATHSICASGEARNLSYRPGTRIRAGSTTTPGPCLA